MVKISDIYVVITEYLLQDINIYWQLINRQYSMLAHTVSHHVLIETYKQERMPKFMLANVV